MRPRDLRFLCQPLSCLSLSASMVVRQTLIDRGYRMQEREREEWERARESDSDPTGTEFRSTSCAPRLVPNFHPLPPCRSLAPQVFKQARATVEGEPRVRRIGGSGHLARQVWAREGETGKIETTFDRLARSSAYGVQLPHYFSLSLLRCWPA